jgi:hypothetical protein
MYRYALAAAAMLAAVSPWAPSYAVTSQNKMATCKFGADVQHLQGKARSAFVKKCMSNKDEPRDGSAATGAPQPQH